MIPKTTPKAKQTKKIKFEVFGPFTIPRDGHKLEEGALHTVWSDIDGASDNDYARLHGLVGVYIFVITDPQGLTTIPWYVGQTSKQSFKERLSQQELNLLKVLEKGPEGTLKIFLLPMKVPGSEHYRKPTKRSQEGNIAWLEGILIGICRGINPNLLNRSKAARYARIIVPGLLNSPEMSKDSEKSFAALFQPAKKVLKTKEKL